MNVEAKCASLDRISNLPSSIIENILCLVSIRDAVRTSILSKNWRYNWVKIPKLVFYESNMFGYTTDENQLSVLEQSFSRRASDRKQLIWTLRVFSAILHVLRLHQGPILEFRLSMHAPDVTCVEILIDLLIILLARNYGALKKFTLELSNCKFVLPRSIFLLHQLKDLYIYFDPSFEVDFDPVSNGFGSLTSLTLMFIVISGKTLLSLLSQCQLLKRFKLLHKSCLHNENVTIIELLNSLPVIERLTFYHWASEDLVNYSYPRELQLPTALVHLKKFCLHDMSLHDYCGLDLVCLVLRSSPNLKKIKLNVEVQHADNLEIPEDSKIESASLKKCWNIWLEHLEELKIVEFSDVVCEMEFVKFILAKSPVLKKVSLVLQSSVTKDKELEISRILTSFPRVSALAEIIVKSRFTRRGVNTCLASAIQLS